MSSTVNLMRATKSPVKINELGLCQINLPHYISIAATKESKKNTSTEKAYEDIYFFFPKAR